MNRQGTRRVSELSRNRVAAAIAVARSIWREGLKLLGPGLIRRALVDDLAVIHVQLVRVDGSPTGHGRHMEVLDTV
jgi:hypothetical protein